MTISTLFKFSALTIGSSLLASSLAIAGANLNAMCYMSDKSDTPQAFMPPGATLTKAAKSEQSPEENLQKKYRIASLSKVLTTHWAIQRLGPEYRFKTKLFIYKNNNSSKCKVHIEGDKDPYFGEDMMKSLFEELDNNLETVQCHNVEAITYDENFVVFLDVMEEKTTLLDKTPVPVIASNPAIFNNGPKTQRDFLEYINKHLNRHDVRNIGRISRLDFESEINDKQANTLLSKYSLKSRPLYKLLKDMNKKSFNFPANVIFERLGDAQGYKEFIKSFGQIKEDEVEIYNGSGYPKEFKVTKIIDGKQSTTTVKKYNQFSCKALIMILKDLDETISNFRKDSRHYRLSDVMAVVNEVEVSTLSKTYNGSNFRNILIAKTGTADLAITFGGMLSTANGHLYFAALTAPERDGEDVTYRTTIRGWMTDLAKKYSLQAFDYEAVPGRINLKGIKLEKEPTTLGITITPAS